MKRVEANERWQRLLDLIAPIHHRALKTARRLSRTSDEGDDLFQETVMRAFEKFSSLRDEGRFAPWFFAVLLSRHRSRGRRAFWRRFLPLEEELETGREPAGEDGGRWEEERTGAERLTAALFTLPASQREAIVLHDIDGFAVREIAAMQKSSESAVKSRLSRGRRKLRRHYEKLGYGDRRETGTNTDKEKSDDDAKIQLPCAGTST